MTDVATNIVDAIVARDGLALPADEYARLVRLYAETQPELVEMRAEEYRYVEPDCTSAP